MRILLGLRAVGNSVVVEVDARVVERGRQREADRHRSVGVARDHRQDGERSRARHLQIFSESEFTVTLPNDVMLLLSSKPSKS